MASIKSSLIAVLTIAALLTSGALTAAPARVVIGQTGAGQPSVNGLPAPSGTTLFSPAELRSGSRPALVYLAEGDVVQLGPGTRAFFEAAEEGSVRIAILSGTVAYRDGQGRVAAAPAETTVVLAQQQPPPDPLDDIPVGEPIQVPVEEEARICVLDVPDPSPELVEICRAEPTALECFWTPVDVPVEDLPIHLARPDVVLPGPESGLNEECEEDDVIPGIVGGGHRAALAAAALLAGWALIDTCLCEDDEQPVTPVRP